MSNYSLEVISKQPEFANKTFKKHHVAGIDTIGVWGNEPFEIKFKNNSFETVQVKLSIDGTDILTGDVANTEISKEMWVVRGYGELVLKAWPESHNGGAQFVFTHAGNAVSTHTHGDTSSMGIIAVAVFREGYKEPARFVDIHHHQHNYWWTNPYYYLDNYWLGSNLPTYNSGVTFNSTGGGTYGASSTSLNSDFSCSVNNVGGAVMDSMDVSLEASDAAPGVGAGDYVEQNITYTTGLKEPYFAETLRVKYLWWDDLVAQLKGRNIVAPHASGFPGDESKGVKLGSTPRLKTAAPKKLDVIYARF
jgi:hypothetical protein